jgi:hypothetical protein
MADTSDLEQGLRELRDIEEIKKLKARYVDACDGGWGGRIAHDPDVIPELFTENCEWDGGAYGNRQGREALREYYLANKIDDRSSVFHLLTSPVIEIDGDFARGEWHLTILLSLNDGGNVLICGVFAVDRRAKRTPLWG